MTFKLKYQLIVCTLIAVWASAALYALVLDVSFAQLLLVTGFASLVAIVLCHYVFDGVAKRFVALETGLLNFRDNEFGVSLAVDGKDEISHLAALYNETSNKLRQEKQWIYQRELMLDKVLQSSPLAVMLLDNSERVIFANASARELLAQGSRIEGAALESLLETLPQTMVEAIRSGRDGLFSVQKDDDEQGSEAWHLSHGSFLMNGNQHKLLLFKQLTRELSRQEVQTWKKVIRVISHELNNSLAPISSMVHSGRLLAEQHGDTRLVKVFETIGERASHLNSFILGYAKFAKLPQPNRSRVDWQGFVDSLAGQWAFKVEGSLPDTPGFFDPAQMQQVLINLLKNAAESGSIGDDISLQVKTLENGVLVEVCDRGSGMSEAVLTQALLPFYSTKGEGTGLGLALCREIVEAHDGRISLSNRAGGGLKVSFFLPG
ncbi:sensor histidine kinase [Bowmanella yangjiangensis]|uniref:histidine kinase n=1 Tax=Bowmanella yangjiangensis TaxID=2811230 RepID=A0ABS3CQP6_9ALTE|nr:ATP-binding protein [Bowmanella yangjiangensis]MBN7819428.1 PAS domain-containing protein [Bowmanella yangjiangensis]